MTDITDTEARESVGESQPKIDQRILEGLNLTPEEIQRYSQEEVERKKDLLNLVQSGRKYYEAIRENPYERSQPIWEVFKHANFTIEDATTASEIPDKALAYVEEMIQSDPKQYGNVRERLNAFLHGFGSEALENFKDWQSAIPAFDISTEGGILNNPSIITKMATLFQDSSTVRVEIAKLIQNRVDARKSPPSTQSSSPTASAND